MSRLPARGVVFEARHPFEAGVEGNAKETHQFGGPNPCSTHTHLVPHVVPVLVVVKVREVPVEPAAGSCVDAVMKVQRTIWENAHICVSLILGPK